MNRALSIALMLILWPVSFETGLVSAEELLDCEELDCSVVLEGATRFEAAGDRPWKIGFDEDGQQLGWVARSIDIVDVIAYSGKPLVTLIGLQTDGVISGARVIEHSEPILLVGIPESALHDFVAFYAGHPATTRVVVGKGREGAIAVDVISGATVTALAQNRTILETARTVGSAVGVIDLAKARPGRFSATEEPLSWRGLLSAGVFGRLRVSQADMGVPDAKGLFVDLWFTIADAPSVGRALLGDGDYYHLMKQLEPGQHLFVILGDGSDSFKGSAFVRGGIFDRVRIEQDLREITFRDRDYHNLPRVAAVDAMRFKEGAAFITRGGQLDPGAEFDLVFLGSRYDHRGGFSRDFHEFRSSHRIPRSIYVVEREDLDQPIVRQAWRNRELHVWILGIYLAIIIALFSARRFTTASLGRLKVMHYSSMIFGFLIVGVWMGAQPSVTQILTLVDSVLHEWRWDLFATEPLIFMSWIFIAIVSLIWGRGVFCGWVCPYGAMTELLHLVASKLGIKQWEPPVRVNDRLRYLRYLVLAGLIPTFLLSPALGERLAEIEPFKSTFLVAFWTRPLPFLIWWLALAVVSIVIYRPFCRYLCPLGAGLSIFGSFRLSGPRRRQFCSSCTICARACEPMAIRPDGTIDPRECLSCMECEATYRNEDTCPPLVGLAKIAAKTDLSQKDLDRRKLLEEGRLDV